MPLLVLAVQLHRRGDESAIGGDAEQGLRVRLGVDGVPNKKWKDTVIIIIIIIIALVLWTMFLPEATRAAVHRSPLSQNDISLKRFKEAF